MIFIPILPPSGKELELTECGTGFLHIAFGWLATCFLLMFAVTIITKYFIPIPEIWQLTVGLAILLGFVIHVIVHMSRYDENGKLKRKYKDV